MLEVSKESVLKPAPVFKLNKPKDDIDKAIQCFLTLKTGRFGNYVATANALVFRSVVTESDGLDMRQDIIAIRFISEGQQIFLGNSAILPNVGRTVSFGNENLNRSRTTVQERLSRLIPMLPFNVFLQAGLDLFKTKIIARGPEETVIRTEEKYNSKTKKTDKIPIEVHFTGASLFSVQDKCFLFDIDRREIQHKIFNPFLVELVKPCKTIDAAYDLLKPKEVKDAEEAGLKVLRQGEWFFIPVNNKLEAVKPNGNDRWGQLEKGFVTAELRAGNNRPNRVSKFSGKATKNDWGRETYAVEYVSGFVEHSGREHFKLVLPGWYKPVPNTSIRSFTVTGDID